VVVRADFHAAEAAEVAFRLIGAHTLVHEGDGVVDAAGIPTGVKSIRGSAFVGIDGGEGADMIANIRDGIAIVANHKGEASGHCARA
jgi:hypothetical protein